jgi:putative addiction module killer protein
LEGLKDHRGRNIIRTRMDRVATGNLGDCRALGGSVQELRIGFGPGYRIYFGRVENDVILLWGGTKQQQAKDISRAKIYWTEYQNRNLA